MAEQKQPGVWGIDLGQCALKALRLEVIDGQVVATAFDYVEHPKILSQPDADPDALTREALQKFLERNTLRGDQVAISVPGQSGLARFVKLPPVEEKKIPDIVRFEAKQQIPFPLEEVVWDFQKIGSGQVSDGFAMETEIGLFALKRDTVNRALQHLKDVGVEVHLVQMAPLALCNFVASDLLGKGAVGSDVPPEKNEEPADEEGEEEEGAEHKAIVALDIGTDNSNLVVTDGEKVIWQRPIPIGGNHFTRALTKDLKLTFAKGEHLKRNATKSPDLKKILASLKPVLNDFVGEVQRSLGYFTNTHRNAQVDYMVGLGNAFRLPGLQKFLSEKLQIEVRKLSKLERLGGEPVITAPAFQQNVLSFATAYGLALQGLQRTRLKTNLLPQEIQFERMIRAKKPWAVAAAAALLLAVFGTTARYAVELHSLTAKEVETAMNSGQETKKSWDRANTEFENKNGDVKKKEDQVRHLIEGTEERFNWLLLNEFIDDCMPIPGSRLEGAFQGWNGQNFVVADAAGKEQLLPPMTVFFVKNQPVDNTDLKKNDKVVAIYNNINPDGAPYWTKDAALAYKKMWDRQAAGQGAGPNPEDEGIQNLVEVNVESVMPRYASSLKDFFEKAKDATKNFERSELLDADQKTPPDGAGWVVELRGYTYHRDHVHFLAKTLLANLATKGRAAEAGKEPAKDAKEAKPAPKAPAGDKAATKSDKERKWDEVIKGRISHAMLFQFKRLESNSTDLQKSEMALGSDLPSLAVNTPVAKPSAGKSDLGGASASSGDSWVPLGGGQTTGGGSGLLGAPRRTKGATGVGDSGRGGAAKSHMLGSGGPMGAGGPGSPGFNGGPPADTTSADANAKNGATRTEFVIYFVWREPLGVNTTPGGK